MFSFQVNLDSHTFTMSHPSGPKVRPVKEFNRMSMGAGSRELKIKQETCSPTVTRYHLLPVCCLMLAACVMPHWPYRVSTTSIDASLLDMKSLEGGSIPQESSRAQGAQHHQDIQATLVSTSGALAFWRQPSDREAPTTDPCLPNSSIRPISHQPFTSPSTTELVTVEGSTLRLNLVVLFTGNEHSVGSRQQVGAANSRLRVEWSRMGRPLLDSSRLSQMIIDETDTLVGKQFYSRFLQNETGRGTGASMEDPSAGVEEQMLEQHPQRSPFMLAPYANQQHLDRLVASGSVKGIQLEEKGERKQLVDEFIGESRSINWKRLETYLRQHSAELGLWALTEDKCSSSGALLNQITRLLVVQVELARITRLDRGPYLVHLCSSTSPPPADSSQSKCFDLSLQLQVLDDIPQLVGPGPQPQLLEPGDRLTLRCQATGFTLPQITWYLDEQQLSESTGVGGGQVQHSEEVGGDRLRIGDYVSQDGVVHSFVNASRAQVSDGGTYKCQASNGLHTIERNARVDVHGIPMIARHLQNLSELAGQPQLAIHCPYSGWPIFAIEWLHLPEFMDQQLPGESSIHRAKRTHPNLQGRENPLAWLTDPDTDQQDDWLAQASAITPGSLDDYPEPLPEDYPQASADYADLEMDFQQLTVGSQAVRRRKREALDLVWIKMPQSRRHQVHTNGTLLIHDVSRADQGLYKCRVIGMVPQGQSTGDETSQPPPEATSNAFQLSILVAPVISPFGSSESLREGMRNFLTCSVIEGDSPVRLQWFKDGRAITSGELALPVSPALDWASSSYSRELSSATAAPASRIRVETNNEYTSTLYFSHVEFKDNGNYTCMASNKAASVNYTTRMLVNVPPKWSKPPKDLDCVAGQSIVIDCQADAYPSARVWWEVGVQAPPEAKGPAAQLIGIQQQQHQLRHLPNHYRTIISNSHIHILENASLVIRDVQRQDQGFYLCQAANNFGSVSALIRLTVNVGASFASKYLLKYTRLYERLELDCDPNGQNQVEAVWLMRRSNNQQLVGSNLSSSANLHANHHSHQFHLQLPEQQQQQSKRQDQQLLSASVAPAAAVTGICLFNVTLKTELITPTSSRQASSAPSSSSVRFREQSLEPGISLEIHQQRQFGEGAAGSNQTSAVTSEMAKLIIGQVSRLHSADFVCRASNRYGSDEKLFRVLVQEPPDSVEELTVVQVAARQVSLAWRPPYSGNLPIIGYTVEWAPSNAGGEPSWTQTRAPLHHQTSFTVGALQPHSPYLVRVRAHNQLGQSPAPRKPLLVVTVDEAPSAPPADLRASPLSSTAFQLIWDAPADSASVKGFYIGYRLANSTDPFVFKAVSIMDTFQVATPSLNGSGDVGSGEPQPHTRRLAVQIGELRRNSRYSAIVQAFNSAGPGPQSDPVEVRTLINDPPGPAQLKANPMGYTSIELQWWFLQATNVDGYYLYFRQALASETSGWQERKLLAQQMLTASSSSTTQSLPSSDSSVLDLAGGNKTNSSPVRYILDGLTCGRAYQIYLVAYNSVGTGQASQIIRAKTRGSTPIAPKAADYIVANLSSAKLNLDSWLDGGCTLLGFTIRFKRLDRGRSGPIDEELAAKSNWQQVINVPSSMEQRPVLLENLEPESWYLVDTVAESEAGKSQATHSFMTLNKFGQVPSEALLEAGSVINGIPALFRVGARTILHTLSPMLILSCICLLLVFAACSLLVARKYNNQNQSADSDDGYSQSEHGNLPQNFQQTSANSYDQYSKSSPSKTATTLLTGSSENSGLMLSGSSLCNDASYLSPAVADSLDLRQFMRQPRQQQPNCASDVINACSNQPSTNTDYCHFHPQQANDNKFSTLIRVDCNGASNIPSEINYMDGQEVARFRTLPHKQRIFHPTTCDKMKIYNQQLCHQIQPNHCQKLLLQEEQQKQQMYSKLRLSNCNSHSSYNLCQDQYSTASMPTTDPSNPFPNSVELSDVQDGQIYNNHEQSLNLALLTQQAKRAICNGGDVLCNEVEAANKLSSILMDCHQQMLNGDQNVAQYGVHNQQTICPKFAENDLTCDIKLAANSNSNPSAANSSSGMGTSSPGTSVTSHHQDPFVNLGCGRDKATGQFQQATGNQPQNGCNAEQNGGDEYALPFLPKWV